MPPKKKKQPKNAFYFFMVDWKEEKEFRGGLKEVSEACQEDWQNLPPNLMEYYKNKEREAKKQDKDDLSNKFTSTGKSYKEVNEERDQAAAFELKMNREITSIMDECRRNLHVLRNRCFYLIHCNVYIYWGEEKRWVPCEVAISEFSLAEGVKNTYHVFPGVVTKDGRLPLGYKLESKQRRESTHEIPDPDDFDKLENNYNKIYSDMMAFLKPNGEKNMPPLFTMEDDFNTNNNMSAVRDFLEDVAGDEDIDFRVYSLPQFFLHLRNTCQTVACGNSAEGFPSLGLALQQLERDYYNFHEEIACEFHLGTDKFQFCSLSVVKRWVFLICEFCCPDLEIPLIPGRHCVLTAKIDPQISSVQTLKPASVSAVDSKRVMSTGTHPKQTSPGISRPTVAQSSSRPVPAGAAWTTGSNPVVTTGAVGWGRGVYSTVPEKARETTEERKPGNVTTSVWQGMGRGAAPAPKLASAVAPTEELDKLKIVDFKKVVDPSSIRTYKTGQTANVVSEIFADDGVTDSLRLPSSRGRGETLAMAMSKKESSAPSFSAADFPAVGDTVNAFGKPQRPIASAWGRGQTMFPK